MTAVLSICDYVLLSNLNIFNIKKEHVPSQKLNDK